MKKITKHLYLLMAGMLFTGFACMAQNAAMSNDSANKKQNQPVMKTYVIERDIPGAGQFTPEKLKDISKTSCTVLKEMGPSIQWIQSYVTGDKVFCVYKAENIELIKEHAKKGGFPANAIYEVSTVISPATAN
jgi:Protein of unknown function (DUF4242)